MIYTSTECENDCFECQIVNNQKLKLLAMVDNWDKTIIIADIVDTKKSNNFLWTSTIVPF